MSAARRTRALCLMALSNRIFDRSFCDSLSSETLAPLVREIGWSYNLIIMEQCEDDLEREFYIRMTSKFGLLSWLVSGEILV